MLNRTDAPFSPTDCGGQVGSILARGVIRWRRQAKLTTISDAQESAPTGENRLELSRETRLSVSEGTRGLTGETPIPPMRADGDDA